MNDTLRKGIFSLTSALVLTGGFVLNPFADSERFMASASLSSAVFAQGKKKPAKPTKPAAQQQKPGPNLNTPEVNQYLTRLRDKLDQNWELADGKNRVTLTTNLGSDGVAADIAVSSAPSNQQAEQAANEAFAKAQPMESLPHSAGEKAKLTIVFESFAGQHDTNRNISTKLDPVAAQPKSE